MTVPPAQQSFAAHRLVIGSKSFHYPLIQRDTETNEWRLNLFTQEAEAIIFLSGTLLLTPIHEQPSLPSNLTEVDIHQMQTLLTEIQKSPISLYHFFTLTSPAKKVF